jgi:hypothetical protein
MFFLHKFLNKKPNMTSSIIPKPSTNKPYQLENHEWINIKSFWFNSHLIFPEAFRLWSSNYVDHTVPPTREASHLQPASNGLC